jgi:hypothetical protein
MEIYFSETISRNLNESGEKSIGQFIGELLSETPRVAARQNGGLAH